MLGGKFVEAALLWLKLEPITLQQLESPNIREVRLLVLRLRFDFEPFPGGMVGFNRTQFFGDDAQNRRGVMEMSYPFLDPNLSDSNQYEDAEEFLRNLIYTEVYGVPEESPILMTESAIMTARDTANRIKYAKMLFETFETQSVYFASSALCTMLERRSFLSSCLSLGLFFFQLCLYVSFFSSSFSCQLLARAQAWWWTVESVVFRSCQLSI
jgi:hypothetical protein